MLSLLAKLNVELVLECHSSIADDSPSLLQALVNLIRQSRLHQECSSDTYKMGPFKTKAVFFVFSFFDKFEPMREFYNPNI